VRSLSSEALPNVGHGSRDTRKDAVRWLAMFSPNCVTRAVCRDIWRDWILADDDSVKQVQRELAEVRTDLYGLTADFNRLGARLAYGGAL
jgi:hypothetical protein